jgi:2Fe-2S iron-sulfur cluster protein
MVGRGPRGTGPLTAEVRCRKRLRQPPWPLFSIKIEFMSTPGPLFRPYDKLVKITIGEKQFEVPDGNMLLRALQYLSPEDVSYGRFCWNEECQYCRVNYDLGPQTQNRTAISCKLMVQEGMRVTEVAQEIKYCLRKLGLDLKVKETKS